jgi:hypothetical protein
MGDGQGHARDGGRGGDRQDDAEVPEVREVLQLQDVA